MKKLGAIGVMFLSLSLATAEPTVSKPEQVTLGQAAQAEATNKTSEADSGAIVIKQGPDFFPGKCGKRKALGGLVTVYEACISVKNIKPKEWESVFASKDKAFKFNLHFTRAIGGKKVSSAFSDALSKTPAQKPEEDERKKFLEWTSALKVERDSVMDISFMDGKAFKVSFVEKTGATAKTFESDDKNLSKSVANIWLGANPVQKNLKDELLQDL